MSSHPPNDGPNPWSDEPGQHGSLQNHDPYHAYQDQTRITQQQPLSSHPPNNPQTSYQPPNSPPYQPTSPSYQQQQHPTSTSYNPEPTHETYQPPSHPPPNFGSPSHAQQQQQHYQSSSYQADDDEFPPSLPPRRTPTDLALPTGQDRTHQIEVMQSYQAAGRKDEHDLNVEILQREFPNIDGSLIAAIYGDSKSLSATREMLGELDG